MTAALEAELSRSALDASDRALATELAYGSVRLEPALMQALERWAPRGLARLDAYLRAVLVVAAYQLLVLERVPAFAAVNEAVAAVRATRGAARAGFANALLRSLAASGERLDVDRAILVSAPGWLREALVESVGEEDAGALLGVGLGPPATTLRVRTQGAPPRWLEEQPRGLLSPFARSVRQGGDPRRLPGFSEGAFSIQEEGAQVVALALGAEPGERVLDACAGRGQKTSLIADLMGSGELWATDLYPTKLEALAREFDRLGLVRPRTACVDWSLGSSDVPHDFDRVLVDAPCSGVGTVRHRPEILRRLRPEDPTRLGSLAATLLRRAAEHARPGGSVLFAVCSVLRQECEKVSEGVRDLLEPCALDPSLTDAVGLPRDAAELRLLPRHGTDGYFVARFRRR